MTDTAQRTAQTRAMQTKQVDRLDAICRTLAAAKVPSAVADVHYLGAVSAALLARPDFAFLVDAIAEAGRAA